MSKRAHTSEKEELRCCTQDSGEVSGIRCKARREKFCETEIVKGFDSHGPDQTLNQTNGAGSCQ